MSQYGSGGGGWGPPGAGGGASGGGYGGYPPPPGGGGGYPPGGGGGGGYPPPPGGGAPGGFGGGPPRPFGTPMGGGMPPPMGPPPPESTFARHKNKIVFGSIGAVVLSCVGCLAFGAYLEKKDNDTYGALAVVCTGQPVPNAHPYAPTPGVHRVVAFEQRDGAWHVHNNAVPDDMLATGVADAELVACLGTETHTRIDTCSFVRTRYGIDIPGSETSYGRTQTQLPMRLVAAATGMMVRQGVAVGPKPRECANYLGSTPGASDFEGDSVGKNEFASFLRGEAQEMPVPETTPAPARPLQVPAPTGTTQAGQPGQPGQAGSNTAPAGQK